MGFFDSWSDLVAAASPWSAVEAEAAETTDVESKVTPSDKAGEENESGSNEEEEEEEEEEMVDPKEKFEAECKESKICAPSKHHFDECVERVTGPEEGKDKRYPNEDCVEEFFHLAHCASQCAAPKVWAALK